MLGGLLSGACGDDGEGVVCGGGWAADGEVDGGGLLCEGGVEEEVNFRAGGEGGVEVLGEGGFEAGFGS